MPKTKTKPKTTEPIAEDPGPGLSKYRPILLVSIYRHAKVGIPEHGIATLLGINLNTWKVWKKKHPSIQEALELGRKEDKCGGNWHEFIYNRLSPDVRELWDKIQEYDELPNGVVQIERLLNTHGKFVRQQLFLYALIHNNFSPSRAMAKVNISKDVMDDWINKEPKFAQLVEEIQFHKKNFVEESLISLIAEGNPQATIFASRSLNKDRGYSTTVEVQHTGQIEHLHNAGTFDIDELEVSEACKKEVLNALRLMDEKKKQARVLSLEDRSTQAMSLLEREIAGASAE